MKISVVIPCYNAAEWLPKTIGKISESLSNAAVKDAEIIVVDDGSSDDSHAVAKKLKVKYPIVVIKQSNQGRFLARKNGIDKAKYEYILLIDTRVFIDKNSIKFVTEQIKKYPNKVVWNGHVNVYKKGNIIARFMDTVTNIGWRRYFSNPRTCDYGIEDFDYYPKGTTCFLTLKSVLNQAVEIFMSQTNDIKNSSDDTLLIRAIAVNNNINLSPKFSCTYFARNTLKQFIPHTFNRGRFFVDGFLKPGTRFYIPLVTILTAVPLLLALSLIYWELAVILVLCAFFLWILEFFIALFLGINAKDSASLWILTPLFSVFYFAGICTAVANLLIKKGRK